MSLVTRQEDTDIEIITIIIPVMTLIPMPERIAETCWKPFLGESYMSWAAPFLISFFLNVMDGDAMVLEEDLIVLEEVRLVAMNPGRRQFWRR